MAKAFVDRRPGLRGRAAPVVLAALCALVVTAAPAAASGGSQVVTLDGQTVVLPNQGDLPKVQRRENMAVNCAPGTIRVGNKVEGNLPKNMTFTAPAGEVVLAVSIKSGQNNVLTVTFSPDNRTADARNTQNISNYVIVYCQPVDNPPACVLTASGFDQHGKKYIQVTVQDPSGLKTIAIDKANNVAVTINPDPYLGKTTPVVITGTKVNQSKGSFLQVTVTDANGKSTTCDPPVPAVKASAKGGAKKKASARRRLRVAPASAEYGRSVTLRGVAAKRRAGQQVTVYAQSCGFTAAVPVGTTRTTKGGAFAYEVDALINATFSARVGGRTTNSALMRVKPAIALEQAGANRYRAVVKTTNGHFLESRAVVLERLVGRRWEVVTQDALAPASSPFDMTVTSAVEFGAEVPAGSKLRLTMSRHEATCYDRVVSAAITARAS